MTGRKPKGTGRKCSFEFEDGRSCQAWALRDSDPPLCRTHSMTAEERSRMASDMATIQALRRRAEVEVKPASDVHPDLTLADVLGVVAPALRASFPSGAPDWSARLCAAGVVLASFPRYMRDTPEHVRELLQQALPASAYDAERMQPDAVFAAMRAEWDRLTGLGWSELHGLVVKPYPSWMFGPGEDAAAIQAARPAPIPPAKAPVRRALDGRAILEREGEVPLLLEAV
jgi:uncharacterized protein YbjT (DUF2867 family)